MKWKPAHVESQEKQDMMKEEGEETEGGQSKWDRKLMAH